jgi:ABC-type Fe2+-enterobactin transport system substrate-binding protein
MEHIQRRRIIKTTLGDLVAALTEEAFLVAADENEANALVADMLSDLLTHSGTWH